MTLYTPLIPFSIPVSPYNRRFCLTLLTACRAGAFVAAPIGSLLWGFGAFALRIGALWASAKYKGHRFDAFDRPPPSDPRIYTGDADGSPPEGEEDREAVLAVKPQKGKFF